MVRDARDKDLPILDGTTKITRVYSANDQDTRRRIVNE